MGALAGPLVRATLSEAFSWIGADKADFRPGDPEKSAFIFGEASESIFHPNYANTDRKRFHGHDGGA